MLEKAQITQDTGVTLLSVIKDFAPIVISIIAAIISWRAFKLSAALERRKSYPVVEAQIVWGNGSARQLNDSEDSATGTLIAKSQSGARTLSLFLESRGTIRIAEAQAKVRIRRRGGIRSLASGWETIELDTPRMAEDGQNYTSGFHEFQPQADWTVRSVCRRLRVFETEPPEDEQQYLRQPLWARMIIKICGRLGRIRWWGHRRAEARMYGTKDFTKSLATLEWAESHHPWWWHIGKLQARMARSLDAQKLAPVIPVDVRVLWRVNQHNGEIVTLKRRYFYRFLAAAEHYVSPPRPNGFRSHLDDSFTPRYRLESWSRIESP